VEPGWFTPEIAAITRTACILERRVDGTGTRPMIAVGRRFVSAARSFRAQRVRTDRQCSSDRFTASVVKGS
jgi:hypothetical protein